MARFVMETVQSRQDVAPSLGLLIFSLVKARLVSWQFLFWYVYGLMTTAVRL